MLRRLPTLPSKWDHKSWNGHKTTRYIRLTNSSLMLEKYLRGCLVAGHNLPHLKLGSPHMFRQVFGCSFELGSTQLHEALTTVFLCRMCGALFLHHTTCGTPHSSRATRCALLWQAALTLVHPDGHPKPVQRPCSQGDQQLPTTMQFQQSPRSFYFFLSEETSGSNEAMYPF